MLISIVLEWIGKWHTKHTTHLSPKPLLLSDRREHLNETEGAGWGVEPLDSSETSTHFGHLTTIL